MNRKISFWLTGTAGVLAAVGLVLLIADVYTCQRYGVHINDVAGIADDGTAIPWPTGEDPFFSDSRFLAALRSSGWLPLDFMRLELAKFVVGDLPARAGESAAIESMYCPKDAVGVAGVR